MFVLEILGVAAAVMFVGAYVYWSDRIEKEAKERKNREAKVARIYDEYKLERLLDLVHRFQGHNQPEFLRHAKGMSHSQEGSVEGPCPPSSTLRETIRYSLEVPPFLITLHRQTERGYQGISDGTPYGWGLESYRRSTTDIVVCVTDQSSDSLIDLKSLSSAVSHQLLNELVQRLDRLETAANADIVIQQQEEAVVAAREAERQRQETSMRQLREQQEQQQRDRLAQDIIRRHQPPPGE